MTSEGAMRGKNMGSAFNSHQTDSHAISLPRFKTKGAFLPLLRIIQFGRLGLKLFVY